MTVKKDPGSYSVTDEPFDVYNATYAPLNTPHGPVTLVFLDGSVVDVRSGYVTSEYSRDEVKMNVDVPGFTVDEITVGGSASFTIDGTPRNDAHLYGKGGSITPRREKFILAYWAEIVRRYAREHPHVPAHAAHRNAVRKLNDQNEAITKAEEQLKAMRAARTQIRRMVRVTLAEDIRTGADFGGAADTPRPYSRETLNGYVIELKNDAGFMRSITAQRDAINGQEN